MQTFARRHGFDLPYLHDKTRAVTCAYGAVCTQDFFGFDRVRCLQYRGRLDESGRRPAARSASVAGLGRFARCEWRLSAADD